MKIDPLEYAWAAAAVPFFLLWLLARRRAVNAERRAEGLAAELKDLKEKPERWEGRIDRYEVLWFPSLTADPKRREVVAIAPGVPHCRSCVQPMAIQKGDWVCAGCGQRKPESIADVTILDGIGREALQHYMQRHPGWRGAEGLSGVGVKR